MVSIDALSALDNTTNLIRYRRHKPEETPLYPIIEQHLPQFLEHLAEHGSHLPRFVTREFDDYLACGRLEHGFLRVKCNGCRHEHLVAFSCKCRGFCPSCGARRMIETSAHLIDHVIPAVPTRQWVLSFPWPLRFLYATRPEVLTRTLGVITRAIETDLIHRAGLTRQSGARSGIVTLIQRFGSALNLNVHLHMIALDGAFTFDEDATRFHEAKAPSSDDMQRLLDRIIHRTVRQLERDGVLIQDTEQAYFDFSEADVSEPDIQDVLNAASMRYRIAIGPNQGQKTLTLRSDALVRSDTQPKPFTVNRDGFSLNASVSCQPHQRARLERLCRYITRPPLALDRLSVQHSGKVVYELKHPFSNGTTHFVFEPVEFLAKLAALVPRPRANLTRYHGVLAPNAKYRSLVVPTPDRQAKKRRRHTARTESEPTVDTDRETDRPLAPLSWAERLKRVFAIDIEVCPKCGGKLRVIATVTQPDVIQKILDHVHQQQAPPRQPPGRVNGPITSEIQFDAI